MESGSETISHRQFVGPPDRYDLATALQFSLLTSLGLRENHSLLDIGCGSLRAGRLLIPYLLPGKYFGIEPNQWLIDDAIEKELGKDLIRIKGPAFSNDADFTLTTFGRQFDFILAQSIFSHASQKQIRRCVSEAQRVLEPRGIFLATFIAGEENYEGDQWVYPGGISYRPDFFARMVQEQGLTCTPLNWSHSNKQSWMALTHPAATGILPELIDPLRVMVLQNERDRLSQRLKKLETLKGLRLIKNINRIWQRA